MIERIIALGILIGIIIRDFLGYGVSDQTMLICGPLLAVVYLLGNLWLIKPSEKTSRTIVITILYGAASASFAFTLTFKLLYLTGSDEMAILSLIILALVFVADLLSAINKTTVLNRWMIWRFGILSICIGICYLIPEDTRIHFTYRKYPDFIKYYDDHKSTESFHDILDDYLSEQATKDDQSS